MLRFAGKEQETLNQKFNELYRYYRNLMFHVAYGILNDVPDAEDAVQHAFLSIYKNFKSNILRYVCGGKSDTAC